MKLIIKNKADVLKYLENLKKAKLENSKEALMKAGFYIQDEVKASIAGQRAEPTSVDTGRFLNSIDVQTLNDKQVIIFTDLEYAKFLEYGTSKLEPRGHFQNTVIRVKADVKDIMANEIKE